LSNFTDRTLALAGIYQACRLVQQVARHGGAEPEALERMLNTLFITDPPAQPSGGAGAGHPAAAKESRCRIDPLPDQHPAPGEKTSPQAGSVTRHRRRDRAGPRTDGALSVAPCQPHRQPGGDIHQHHKHPDAAHHRQRRTRTPGQPGQCQHRARLAARCHALRRALEPVRWQAVADSAAAHRFHIENFDDNWSTSPS